MLLSLILAWAAVVCTAMTALKFIARISKNRALNRFFRKCHIPFGVLLLVTGGLHGLLAGNPSWATLSDFQLAPVLLTWNWGTVCLLLSLALAATYLLRKKLGRKWMTAHRALTVAMLACLVLHLFSMGIQLPSRLLGSTEDTAQVEVVTGDSAAASAGTSASTDAAASSSAAAASDASASSGAAASSDTATSSSAASGVVTFSGAVLKDGTYQGSADGYNGTISVTVTVEGGQVTNITVDSESDTSQFFSRAESVLDTITGEQSLEVDTVTGATFSSAGLINAVADALQGAVTSGTLQVTDIDLSSVSRRGH
jgi:uncharacterized protein with FMN-binding domain